MTRQNQRKFDGNPDLQRLESFFNGKTVCVTGANGFIGRVLVDSLTGLPCKTRILSRSARPDTSENVTTFVGDLTAASTDLSSFLDDCDIFFHCAGEITDTAKMTALHVNGTQKLLNDMQRSVDPARKATHWIQLSSCGAYGPGDRADVENARVVTEESPDDPRNVYEITKTKSDALVIDQAPKIGLAYTILRPSNVLGPTMSNKSVNRLIRTVRNRRFFFIGKSDAIATYIHVDDVVNAMLSIAMNPRSRGHTFNISSDCTWLDLVVEIATLTGAPTPKLRVPWKLIQMPASLIEKVFGKLIGIPDLALFARRTRYPTTKIESRLDFKISRPMPSGIKDNVEQSYVTSER